MKQALHIFRKDFLYVRKELAVLVLLMAPYVWSRYLGSPVWVEGLMWVAAALVVARLIQAEALPGDRQFWLTRPYSRKSLVIAKLLGVAVYAGMPIFAARLYVMMASDLGLAAIAGPLVWAQAVALTGLLLPIASLAAVTRTMTPFTFTAVGAVAVVQISQLSISPITGTGVRSALTGSQWIWDAIFLATLAIMAALTIGLQYALRRTWLSRTAMGLSLAAGLALYVFLPWSGAARLQAAIPPFDFDPSRLEITFQKGDGKYWRPFRPGVTGFELALQVDGIPQDVEILPDAIDLSIETEDGGRWASTPYSYTVISKRVHGPGPAVLDVNLQFPDELVSQGRGKKAKISGELYVSIFGNAQNKKIALDQGPRFVSPTMECRIFTFERPSLRGDRIEGGRVRGDQLYCGSAFRWPDKIIYADFPGVGRTPFTRDLSYSPFPTHLFFAPFEGRAVSVPRQTREVTLVMAERLASVRHKFELRDFPLADEIKRVIYR